MNLQEINYDVKSNIQMAYDLGLSVSRLKIINLLTNDEMMEVRRSEEWTIIDDLVAMKDVEGERITFSAWWDGEQFTGKVCSIHDPFLCDGQRGPELDENVITMFVHPAKIMRKYFSRLSKLLKTRYPDYRGFVSLDVKISESGVYYQKIRFGISYDFACCFSELYGISIEDVSDGVGQDMVTAGTYSGSMRVYSYPYNVDLNKKILDGIEIGDVYDGMESYIVAGTGDQIFSCWDGIREKASQFPSYVVYRLDGDKLARQTFKKFKGEKYL